MNLSDRVRIAERCARTAARLEAAGHTEKAKAACRHGLSVLDQAVTYDYEEATRSGDVRTLDGEQRARVELVRVLAGESEPERKTGT